MKIELLGKLPIKPTVEAIEDKQRCIDFWAERAIKAENEVERLRAIIRSMGGDPR